MERLRTVCATATGTKHSERGEENQDTAAVSSFTDPAGRRIHLSALADGAGSSAMAADASTIAVSAFLKKGRELFSALEVLDNTKPTEVAEPLEPMGPADAPLDTSLREAMKACFRHARRALLERAKAEDRPPSDYHSTLIGCCIIETEAGGHLCVTAGIGDGVVIAGEFCSRDPDSRELTVRSILPITKGEYGNMTLFLTSDEWEQVFYSKVLCDPSALFISSDGLDNVYFDEVFDHIEEGAPFYCLYRYRVDPFEKYLRRLWAGLEIGDLDVEKLEMQILSSGRVMELNDDDKSLILHCMPGRIPHIEEDTDVDESSGTRIGV